MTAWSPEPRNITKCWASSLEMSLTFFSFVFNKWKACFLGGWDQVTDLLLQFALGHYPFALWSARLSLAEHVVGFKLWAVFLLLPIILVQIHLSFICSKIFFFSRMLQTHIQSKNGGIRIKVVVTLCLFDLKSSVVACRRKTITVVSRPSNDGLCCNCITS